MINEILARRSIRKYTDEPVSAEHITAMLEAAMSAPSGMNRKPWHFVVVTERETLDRLGDTTKSWGMLKEAPLSVIVCGDPGISENYWDQDSVAALENMLVAVSMLGLGAVWLGCHPNAERVGPAREILGIPDDIIPIAVVSIGHPAEEKEARTQYDAERVHKERW